MNRAEERAFEAYPIVKLTAYNEDAKIVTIDANEEPRRLFMEGYRQAEKDLRELAAT